MRTVIERCADGGMAVRVDGELRCVVTHKGKARARLASEGRERYLCESYSRGERDPGGDFYFTAKDIETAAHKAVYFFSGEEP